MSEDLAKQLASYKAQLQQVEAALSGNGENEDLLKLKKDLQVSYEGTLTVMLFRKSIVFFKWFIAQDLYISKAPFWGGVSPPPFLYMLIGKHGFPK